MATIDALGAMTTSVYDGAGRAVAAVDALGRMATTVYDELSRQVASVDMLGNRNTQVYDAVGAGIAAVDTLGARTTSVYDAAGRRLSTVEPTGGRTTLLYDSVGRQVGVQDALGHIRTSVYDESGVAATVDPLGHRTTSLFDALGRRYVDVDALGRRTTETFDALGRPLATENAIGHRTTSVYDPLDGWSAMIDPLGRRTTIVRDLRGSEVGAQDALGQWTTYVHDTAGHVAVRIDARGWPTTYTVDALGRTVGQAYLDGTRVTYAYDPAGQQVVMGDATGLTTYVYDALGRRAAVLDPRGWALTSTYDAAGRRVVLADPYAGRTTYTYAQGGWLTGLVNPFAETTTFVYDVAGYEARRVLANGITVSHTYDAAGRETVLSYRKPTGEAVAVYSSVYDALGNRLSQVELDGSIASYTHDAAYRMTAERRSGASPYHLTYTYDAVGNRLTMVDQDGARTTYSYNAGNELTQAEASETTEFAYDANGNLCIETASGGSTTYTWDGEDRLLGTVEPDAGRWTYAYAADGLRREAATGAESRRYLWDGFDLLSESDASLSPAARYTTSPGAVLAQNRGGTPSFYAFDGPSNTRLLLDAAGAVSDSYVYQAFGVEEAVSGSTVNALRFGGQVGYQRDLGERVYVRARYYAPAVGRWVSRDRGPQLDHPSTLYTYSRNRASTFTDPSGLFIFECAGLHWLRNYIHHTLGFRCDEGATHTDTALWHLVWFFKAIAGYLRERNCTLASSFIEFWLAGAPGDIKEECSGSIGKESVAIVPPEYFKQDADHQAMRNKMKGCIDFNTSYSACTCNCNPPPWVLRRGTCTAAVWPNETGLIGSVGTVTVTGTVGECRGDYRSKCEYIRGHYTWSIADHFDWNWGAFFPGLPGCPLIVRDCWGAVLTQSNVQYGTNTVSPRYFCVKSEWDEPFRHKCRRQDVEVDCCPPDAAGMSLPSPDQWFGCKF